MKIEKTIQQFNEDALNNNISGKIDRNEQKLLNNQAAAANNGKSTKVNSTAKFVNANDQIRRPSSKSEAEINWPNYDDDQYELKKVANRFVAQIVEDATKEVEKRLKSSTSRQSYQSSGKPKRIWIFCFIFGLLYHNCS